MLNPGFVKARSRARRRAMQALYQWQMSGNDLQDIDQQFQMELDTSKLDMDYFRELLHEVPAHLNELDALLSPHMERPLENVDPVEQAILRIAAYELSKRLDVPFRVVLNEAVELCKKFGATKSHAFVNGVLDKVAQQLRKEELGAPQPK